MPPPPSLPVAPDRAAISNRISLLLAQRASKFKLSATPSSHPAEEQRVPPPNAGVGYTGPSKPRDQEEFLRKKLLKRSVEDESDQDHDEGRSSLGRKKKKSEADIVQGQDEPRALAEVADKQDALSKGKKRNKNKRRKKDKDGV